MIEPGDFVGVRYIQPGNYLAVHLTSNDIPMDDCDLFLYKAKYSNDTDENELAAARGLLRIYGDGQLDVDESDECAEKNGWRVLIVTRGGDGI